MWLQIYVYTDDPVAPTMVDELAEYEEAVECCRELVSLEGYPRAEVWTTDGECVYGTGQRRGATWELDRSYALRPDGLRTDGLRTDGLRTDGLRADGPRADESGDDERRTPAESSAADAPTTDAPTTDASTSDASTSDAAPASAPPPLRFLGGHPKASERWFGL